MKPKLIIVVIFFSNYLFAQDYRKTFAEEAFSRLLAGQLDLAEKSCSSAINADSLAYDNYYLRGVIRLYKEDTMGAVYDFIRSIELKRTRNHLSGDTTLKRELLIKPEGPTGKCSEKYTRYNDDLFFLQMATWYLIVDENKKQACRTYTGSKTSGLKFSQAISKTFCN